MNAVKTILFVENDPVALTMYQNRLQREGFHVETAADGLAALKFVSQFSPDVVVLDLMLPRFSGAEVFKYMRKDPRLRTVPVVIFSNAAMTDWPQDLAAGSTQCLPKSESTFPQLLQTIKDLIAAAPVGATPPSQTAARPAPAPAAATAAAPTPAPLPAVIPAAPSSTQGNGNSAPKGRTEFVRESLADFPKLHALCLAYIKAPVADASRQHLTTLLQRVQTLSVEAAQNGCIRVAMLTNAFGALLAEVMNKPSWATPSMLQTMAQAVDCLRFLLKSDDAALADTTPKAKVLAVDDDPVCNHVMVTTLRRANFDITSLGNPLAALQLLQGNRFDLVLLDVNMPDLTGFEVCVKLRHLPHCKTIPVIFVTAFNNFENRKQSVLSGGDDFITKPISPLELALKVTIHVLKSQVKRGNAPQPEIESVAPAATRPVIPPVSQKPVDRDVNGALKDAMLAPGLRPPVTESDTDTSTVMNPFMIPQAPPGSRQIHAAESAFQPAAPAPARKEATAQSSPVISNPFMPAPEPSNAAPAGPGPFETPFVPTEPVPVNLSQSPLPPPAPLLAGQFQNREESTPASGASVPFAESEMPVPPPLSEPTPFAAEPVPAEPEAAQILDNIFQSDLSPQTSPPETGGETPAVPGLFISTTETQTTDTTAAIPAEPAPFIAEPETVNAAENIFEAAVPAPAGQYEASGENSLFPPDLFAPTTQSPVAGSAETSPFDLAAPAHQPSPANLSEGVFRPAVTGEGNPDALQPGLFESGTESHTSSPQTANPFGSTPSGAEPAAIPFPAEADPFAALLASSSQADEQPKSAAPFSESPAPESTLDALVNALSPDPAPTIEPEFIQAPEAASRTASGNEPDPIAPLASPSAPVTESAAIDIPKAEETQTPTPSEAQSSAGTQEKPQLAVATESAPAKTAESNSTSSTTQSSTAEPASTLSAAADAALAILLSAVDKPAPESTDEGQSSPAEAKTTDFTSPATEPSAITKSADSDADKSDSSAPESSAPAEPVRAAITEPPVESKSPFDISPATDSAAQTPAPSILSLPVNHSGDDTAEAKAASAAPASAPESGPAASADKSPAASPGLAPAQSSSAAASPERKTGSDAPAGKQAFDQIAVHIARIIFGEEELTEVKIRLVRIALQRYTVEEILNGTGRL